MKPKKETIVLRKVSDLEAHPAAIVPIDEEDSAAIGASVREIGILNAVLITPDNKILDGVNRWRQAKAAGIQKIWCRITNQPPGLVVATSLMARRKGSSAQHIIVFLEAHKNMVLQAYEHHFPKGSNYAERQKALLKKGQCSPEGAPCAFGKPGTADDPFAEWSSRAIAQRLKVDRHDVQKGIEFLVCRERKLRPDEATIGERDRPLDMTEESDRRYAAEMDEYRNAALSGQPANLRRWKAAVASRAATKGADAPKAGGKAKTDYPALFKRSAISLANCFEHFSEIQSEGGDEALAYWTSAVQSMPEALLIPICERLTSLPLPERKRIINVLKKDL